MKFHYTFFFKLASFHWYQKSTSSPSVVIMAFWWQKKKWILLWIYTELGWFFKFLLKMSGIYNFFVFCFCFLFLFLFFVFLQIMTGNDCKNIAQEVSSTQHQYFWIRNRDFFLQCMTILEWIQISREEDGDDLALHTARIALFSA